MLKVQILGIHLIPNLGREPCMHVGVIFTGEANLTDVVLWYFLCAACIWVCMCVCMYVKVRGQHLVSCSMALHQWLSILVFEEGFLTQPGVYQYG